MYKSSRIFAQCSKCQSYTLILKRDIVRRSLKKPLSFFMRNFSDNKTANVASGESEELTKVDLTPSKSAKHRVTAPCHPFSQSFKEDNKASAEKQNSKRLQNKRKGRKTNALADNDSLLNWVTHYKNLHKHTDSDIEEEESVNTGSPQVKNNEDTARYVWKNWRKPNKLQNERSEPLVDIQGEILFGQFPVLLALQTMRRKIYSLMMKTGKELSTEGHYADILSIAKQNDIEVTFCERSMLNWLSKDRPHQGVCLDVKHMKPKPFERDGSNLFREELSTKTKPCVWLYVHAVQDPMNLGAILRTSCFMNVEKVFMSENDSCPLSPVVSKASAGALEIMDINSLSDQIWFFNILKENGWSIIGTVGRNRPDRSDQVVQLERLSSISERTIVLLGNEGTGLPEDLLDLCTSLVSITPGNPDSLHTNLDSLNVSVATGIILHHVISLNSSWRTGTAKSEPDPSSSPS